MEFLRDFKNISKNDVSLAGGKGASLGEMTKVGIPVPSGFVILSNAFEKILEETDLNVEIDSILDSVNHKEIHTVERASGKIKAIILQAEMPRDIAVEVQKFFKNLDSKYVAVRSSATAEDSASAAWAGQLESYLNTTEENLLENVKKCWASLFTPRAIFYRFEKDLHKQKISVAVVIQKMIESEKSGIAFSVHPVTQDHNQLIIEAGLGLGEAIVSGQITPDSYVVEKQPRRIIDKNVETQSRGLYRAENGGNEWHDILKEQAEKQILSDEEILELSEIILRIENHYGFPCDIEWAFGKERFYIVQSRPITTLMEKSGLTFEKSITRDWGIVYAEIWHKVFTKEFKKQIGWGYTEVIFEGKNNTITVYRAPKEHIDGMRDFILSQIDKNKSWLDKHAIKVKEKVDDTISWIEKIEKKKLEDYSQKELAEIFEKFVKINLELGPRFIMMLWFPIQMEHNEKLQQYKTAVDVAIDTRTQIEKIGPLVDTFARKMGAEVSRRAKIDETLSKFIDSFQIEDYLKNNILPEQKILLARHEYFIVTNDGILSEKIEDYLKRYKHSLRKIDISNIDVIKGNTAYPGIVQGIVKIIHNKAAFSKLNDGEILVTGMTTPDFLPVMKKSIGFITDEGGVTCHAAIVAREMKKPCVIGTKIATEVLKDGDLVELDADSGIVRLIKK